MTPVIKVNKSKLKWYSNDGKTHAKHPWKTPSRVNWKSKLFNKGDASISPHMNLTK